jgi:lipopolysaccharide export system protein LptA
MIGRQGASRLLVALFALLLASPVAAQLPGRSNAPIDITADEADVVNSKCITTWRGSAEALQGKTRLRADTIVAYLKVKAPDAGGQPGCGATDRIEAQGDVFYVTPTQVARGDHAIYTADASQIVMTGDVIVVQGKDVARGDKLTINTTTNEAWLDSAVQGRGKPGRVRGVFYPNQPGAPGSPAPAPALP